MKTIHISNNVARRFIEDRRKGYHFPGGKNYALALEDDNGDLLAAVFLGRPQYLYMSDGQTLEAVAAFTDVETDGAGIYRAAAKAAFALGFSRVVVYTKSEDDRNGGALKLAGYDKGFHGEKRVRWTKERGAEK